MRAANRTHDTYGTTCATIHNYTWWYGTTYTVIQIYGIYKYIYGTAYRHIPHIWYGLWQEHCFFQIHWSSLVVAACTIFFWIKSWCISSLFLCMHIAHTAHIAHTTLPFTVALSACNLPCRAEMQDHAFFVFCSGLNCTVHNTMHYHSLILFPLFPLFPIHCITIHWCSICSHCSHCSQYTALQFTDALSAGNLPRHDWKANTPHSQGGN